MFTLDKPSGRLTAIASLIMIIVLSINSCEPAAGQKIKDVEKAVLVSYGKEKRFTTYWIVCVKSETGHRYSFKYNVHSYRVKRPRIATKWNIIITKRRKYFTPQL